ncbi:fibronectin type III domain-containing protein [Halopiger goleimassiliensis]|uniref:fibronectin type III domain-containing protein n=1 Tax=Halopiger goleimassiliensis TaxID=1293048 RepID=UPI000677DEDB|nr:fibronectin type III domain-containing protein [Halopiger goleimassiliensis]
MTRLRYDEAPYDATSYGLGLPRRVTGLEVEGTSEGSVSLSWDPAGSADEYAVLRSRSPDSGYTEVAVLANTAYTDDALVAGRTYHYKVLGRNITGDGPLSAEVTATTDLAPPQLTFDTSQKREITVTVDLADDNDEGEVRLERDGSEIATLTDLDTLEYSDADSILDGEAYDYVAIRDTGDATARTDPETAIAYIPPVEDLDLDGTEPQTLVAQWTDILNNGRYRVQIRDDTKE